MPDVLWLNSLTSPLTYEYSMTLLRCLLVLLLATLLICTSAERVCAQKPTRNFVEIEFPIGDIEVIFVESSRGMILVATSGTIRMRARRIYFGDGKRAVKYEASNSGIETPSSNKKIGGGFDIDDGMTIIAESTKLEEWGAKSNEIYVKVPNLKFKVKDQERQKSAK